MSPPCSLPLHSVSMILELTLLKETIQLFTGKYPEGFSYRQRPTGIILSSASVAILLQLVCLPELIASQIALGFGHTHDS